MQIYYNILNLPCGETSATSGSLTYTYLPYGTKISVGSATLAAKRYRLGGKEEQVFGSLDLGKVDFGAIQYDPFTARWMAVDPMAAKYAGMSPYGYCAADPVNIVDPQGDTLFVKHGKETLMYLNGLFYYSDGKEYTGKIGGFLKRVNNAISSICQTDTGRAIIEELETSKNVFTIDYAESNSFVPDRAIDAGANLPVVMSMRGGIASNGSGGTIKWNPYNIYGGVDITGSAKRPSFLGLTHEMAHALDANRGLLHFSSDYGQYSASYLGIKRAEWHAVSIENRVRFEAGIPLRAYYGRTEDGRGFGPNMLLFLLTNHVIF